MWEKDLLVAEEQAEGLRVRWFHIVPVDEICAHGNSIRVAERRIAGVSLASLVAGKNPCAVRQSDLAARRRRHELIFSSIGSSIAARCAGQEHVLSLPRFQMFDSVRVATRIPDAPGLWDLFGAIATAAFGKESPFPATSVLAGADQDSSGSDRLLMEGAIDELTSGRYDSLLERDCDKQRNCEQMTFRRLLDDYHTSELRAHYFVNISIKTAGDFEFSEHPTPAFPPLAKLTRTRGTVRLKLLADPATGEIRDVVLISGHPLLARPTVATVKRWRLKPASTLPTEIEIEAQFAYTCEVPGGGVR